jgi:hypothetical protein
MKIERRVVAVFISAALWWLFINFGVRFLWEAGISAAVRAHAPSPTAVFLDRAFDAGLFFFISSFFSSFVSALRYRGRGLRWGAAFGLITALVCLFFLPQGYGLYFAAASLLIGLAGGLLGGKLIPR